MAENNNVQNIRRSQFILTYGPGSILEGRNGPRIIPTLGWGFGNNFGRILKEYEVTDIRMSNVIKKRMTKFKDKDVRFFKIPSNASLRKSDNQGIYRTYIFPAWKICYGKEDNHDPILYNSLEHVYCPLCHKNPQTNIRFVCACPDGHLDEVKWNYVVHKGKTECESDYFYWNARGSSLSSIIIGCPKCGSKNNMGEIYKGNFKCTGRHPEREQPTVDYGICLTNPKRYYNCDQRMKVVQRQSTSLRIADTLTLLKIPKYSKPIANVLQYETVASFVMGSIEYMVPEEKFISALKKLRKIPEDSKGTILEYIAENGYDDMIDLAEELYDESIGVDNVLIEEFKTLKDKESCSDVDNFCKGPPSSFTINFGKHEFPIDVFPVDKLKTVTVQIGYQRKPYLKKDKETKKIIESKIVPCGASRSDGSTFWYPVYEGIGEGIFITSEKNPIDFLDLSENSKEWMDNKPQYPDRWRENEVKNPVFIWWHTLSHALIRSLSFSSGYSSSSIRERIYLDSDNRGGIFLYNTSPGEDCGMGGLVESTNNIKEIIYNAIKNIDLCSHDPLCSEIRISSDRVNGSACHNCLLIPETSCEHGNMWLDRHIINGD